MAKREKLSNPDDDLRETPGQKETSEKLRKMAEEVEDTPLPGIEASQETAKVSPEDQMKEARDEIEKDFSKEEKITLADQVPENEKGEDGEGETIRQILEDFDKNYDDGKDRGTMEERAKKYVRMHGGINGELQTLTAEEEELLKEGATTETPRIQKIQEMQQKLFAEQDKLRDEIFPPKPELKDEVSDAIDKDMREKVGKAWGFVKSTLGFGGKKKK